MIYKGAEVHENFISGRKKVFKKVAALIRKTEKVEQEVKKAAIKDIRLMLKDDDYLLSVSHVHYMDADGESNAKTLDQLLHWSSTRSQKNGEVYWSDLDDIITISGLKAGKYEVKIKPRYIEVGCQMVTWEQYDALIAGAKLVKKGKS